MMWKKRKPADAKSRSIVTCNRSQLIQPEEWKPDQRAKVSAFWGVTSDLIGGPETAQRRCPWLVAGVGLCLGYDDSSHSGWVIIKTLAHLPHGTSGYLLLILSCKLRPSAMTFTLSWSHYAHEEVRGLLIVSFYLVFHKWMTCFHNLV